MTQKCTKQQKQKQIRHFRASGVTETIRENETQNNNINAPKKEDGRRKNRITLVPQC